MTITIFWRRGLFGKRWYFRVVAENGQTIAQSEGYKRRADAVSTAFSMRGRMFDARIEDEEQ
jgi:uncharacterized protein YegP (UPF0339 family)